MGNAIYKNSIAAEVGTTWTAIYTAPSGKDALVLQLNGTVVNNADLLGSVRIWDSSTSTYCYLIKQAPIGMGDSLRIIDQAKIVLEAGDKIEVKCDTPLATIDFVSSFVEDVTDVELGTFKNALKASVGNSWTTLYQAPGGITSFMLQINAANTASTGVQVSVRIYDSSANKYASLAYGLPLPIADAIRIIDHSKIVLEAGDKIEVKCDTAGQTVDVTASLIQDVN